MAAQVGDTYALMKLAELRNRAGDRATAERLCRLAADAGDGSATAYIGRLLKRAGAVKDAHRLLRFGLDADGNIAAPWTFTGIIPGLPRPAAAQGGPAPQASR
jgi:hypothetical protein